MLDTVLKQHSNRDIIHEISRPTLVQAALERVAIVSEFRQRLDNDQMLVADFKGYDVPYSAKGRFYYASLTNLVTMMATAPNEAIQEAIQEANTDQKRVQLKNPSTQVIVMGSFKPSNVKDLKPYVEQNQIFAIALGSAITRSKDPNATIAQFLTEINKLVPCTTVKESDMPQLYFDAHWAAIAELTRHI